MIGSLMECYRVHIGNLAVIWFIFLFTVVEQIVTNGRWLRFILMYFLVPVLPILLIFIDMTLSQIKKFRWEKFSINKISAITLVILTFLSLPWLSAIVNADISKAPLLNSIFLFPNHVGIHHGYEAWFAFVSIILLLPIIKGVRNNIVKRLSIVLLVILLIITLQNFIDDFIVEQLEPRFGIKSPFGIFRGII